MRQVAALLLLGVMCFSSFASADQTELPIPNILQETPVWCWAAVSEQIVLSMRGRAATPRQCAMVAAAKNASPAFCCQNPMSCAVTGDLSDIQNLIQYFGGSPSKILPPTDPFTLYGTLASGHPVIMQLKMDQAGMAHVVVIRGMAIVPSAWGPRAFLFINDPLQLYTEPIPFEDIIPMWKSAIVVN
ncbi:papain-like cysteine protease family protein [Pseudomonas neuropathica]|uniref:papain-like cysteine protease family protein n=1 Tax=Pseudomonas neuropathica TaxID=2730425 RepID=UPI003EBE3EAC